MRLRSARPESYEDVLDRAAGEIFFVECSGA